MSASPRAELGIIGGSGLYDMEGLTDREELTVSTPFGEPSGTIVLGTLEGQRLAFPAPARRRPPAEPERSAVPCQHLRAEDVGRPFGYLNQRGGEPPRGYSAARHDRPPIRSSTGTKGRPSTFFSGGIVAHTGFADPFCSELGRILYEEAAAAGARTHLGGVYIAMEGPQFSTRAESEMYRSWGGAVIGMTALPEAKLAREAELCYALLACATDYDCWHPDHDDVTVEMIVRNLMKNVSMAKEIARRAAARTGERQSCRCREALRDAIVTSPDLIPEQVRRDLAPLIGKYAEVS